MWAAPSSVKQLSVLVALAMLATGCTSAVKGEADQAAAVAATSSPVAGGQTPVDSDGDGLSDDVDLRPHDATIRSWGDLDTDRDGVKNSADYKPKDPSVQTRNDIDTDNDGVADFRDAFPRNPQYSKDTDTDGVADAVDDFPNDARYSKDTDGDHVADAVDAFPTDPSRSKITLAMQNALGSANDYLAMDGFSRQGLIDQLSSSYGEGFNVADAEWAVDQLHANWNEEAYQSAKGYLAMDSFSRQGLIDQLSSSYGEQFTLGQAIYAVNKLGL